MPPWMCWKRSRLIPTTPSSRLENVTLTAHVASASSRYEEGARIRVGREIGLVLRRTLAHVLRESVGAGQLRPPEVATRVAEGPHPHSIINQ